MTTVEYAPGRHLVVYGTGSDALALLWHGGRPDSITEVTGVAGLLADRGLRVLVPDWNPDAADGGRADLLGSVRYARETCAGLGLDPADLILAGWSLGATAALSLTLHAKRLGIDLGGTVLVAPDPSSTTVDPISGSPLPERLSPGDGREHIEVVGDARLADRLRAAGWSVGQTLGAGEQVADAELATGIAALATRRA